MFAIKLLNKFFAILLCGAIVLGALYSLGSSIFNSTRKETQMEVPYPLKESRMKFRGIKSYATIDTMKKKSNNTYFIRLNVFNIDGSSFAYSINTDKQLDTFEKVAEENILSVYQSYEVKITTTKQETIPSTSKSKNKVSTKSKTPKLIEETKSVQYVAFLSNKGEGDYSKALPLVKKAFNVENLQSASDNGDVVGLFDFAYNLNKLSLKEKQVSDTVLSFTGNDINDSDITAKILLNSKTHLPISEEYNTDEMHMTRLYIGFDIPLPRSDDLWKATQKDQLSLLMQYINENKIK